MGKLKFKNFLYSEPMNTKNVVRYQTCYMNQKDTLNDHITHVSMMGYMYIKYLDKVYNEKINIGNYLELCLVHDIPEVVTSDIIRTVKHNNEKIHKEVENLSRKIAEKLCNNYFDSNTLNKILNDKDMSSKEGILLKVFDMLDVARYIILEVEVHHNFELLKVVYECNYYLSKLREEILEIKGVFDNDLVTKDIWSLIYDANNSLETILLKYDEIYTEYGINRRVLL